MIEECGNDAKKMYRAVNNLNQQRWRGYITEGEEDKVVANKFMDFFK